MFSCHRSACRERLTLPRGESLRCPRTVSIHWRLLSPRWFAWWRECSPRIHQSVGPRISLSLSWFQRDEGTNEPCSDDGNVIHPVRCTPRLCRRQRHRRRRTARITSVPSRSERVELVWSSTNARPAENKDQAVPRHWSTCNPHSLETKVRMTKRSKERMSHRGYGSVSRPSTDTRGHNRRDTRFDCTADHCGSIRVR